MDARGTFTQVTRLGFEARPKEPASTMRRFVRWGLIRGPLWGLAAALLAVPVATIAGYDESMVRLALVALLGGTVGGPVLGAVAGASCVLADRAPKSILDAPDYIAVLAVIGTIALVAWPALNLGHGGLTLGLAIVVALGLAPAADAAAHAPRLLRPASAATDAAPDR